MSKIVFRMISNIRLVFDKSPFAPPKEIVLDPHHQGIGRHFESVGVRLDRAAKEYSRTHPEVPTYA